MRKERKYYRLSECGSVSAAAVLSPCYMLPATHKHICEQVFVLGIVSLQNNCYPGHYLCRDVSEGGEFSPYFPCALRNVSSWHFKLRFYSFMAAVSTYGHQRLTLLLGSHPLLCQMVWTLRGLKAVMHALQCIMIPKIIFWCDSLIE